MGGLTRTEPHATVHDEVLLARAFLSRAAEPACIPLWQLVREVGPVETVRRLRCGDVEDEMLKALSKRVDAVDPHADLDAARRHDIRLVVPESDEWPHFALAALERTGELRLKEYKSGKRAHADGGEPIPPLALWVRGPLDISTLAIRSVGVVGARSASPYGQRVASDLGYGLALRDFTVVSGGAYGIDAAAHRGALAAEGSTVIVSAGGAERAYPASHQQMFAQAAGRGAIVSESPVGCAPRRARFLTRNRLIAAFATGTVIVEASARSGALNTAAHVDRLDRVMMAIPGPVTSAVSVGCHNLLKSRERCQLVTGVEDVVAIIGSSGEMSAALVQAEQLPAVAPTPGRHRSPALAEIRRRLDELDSLTRAVYDGMPAKREITADELAASCALSVLDVIRNLPALELAGPHRTDPRRLPASPGAMSRTRSTRRAGCDRCRRDDCARRAVLTPGPAARTVTSWQAATRCGTPPSGRAVRARRQARRHRPMKRVTRCHPRWPAPSAISSGTCSSSATARRTPCAPTSVTSSAFSITSRSSVGEPSAT